MTVMICMGICYTCHKTFMFSPSLVPAIPANLTTTGEKEPKECVDRANPERIKNGLPKIEILPGAYEAEDA
jgi:hypothetical protein